MDNKKKGVTLIIVVIIIFITIGVVISASKKKQINGNTIKGSIEITQNNSAGDKGLAPESRTAEEIEYDNEYPTVMIEDKDNILEKYITDDGIPYTKKSEMISGIAKTFKDNGCNDVETVIVISEETKYESNRIYIEVQDKDNPSSRISCVYVLPTSEFYYKYFEK